MVGGSIIRVYSRLVAGGRRFWCVPILRKSVVGSRKGSAELHLGGATILAGVGWNGVEWVWRGFHFTSTTRKASMGHVEL